MPRARTPRDKSAKSNGANLGFEEKLWAAADKLRGHMDAAEYKHVVLGLIFLKCISDAFQQRYEAVSADEFADPEDRDEYTAENVFWVPKAARWPCRCAAASMRVRLSPAPSPPSAMPCCPSSSPARFG